MNSKARGYARQPLYPGPGKSIKSFINKFATNSYKNKRQVGAGGGISNGGKSFNKSF